MIASEKRHNTNVLDASFSTQERLTLKLTKNKVEDDELGIFGAEKYFTGGINEDLRRTDADYRSSNRPQHKYEESCPAPKPRTPKTPSVRSESSWNSRRGLLVNNGNDHKKKNCVRSLLATLGCNCNDKSSVKTTDNKFHVKELVKQPVNKSGDLVQKTKSLSSRWTEKDVHGTTFEFNELKIKREDYFTFPMLKHSDDPPEDERRYSSEVFGSPVLDRKRSFSLERKLTMLNWDGVTPIIDISRNRGDYKDTGSDASSDLFEIESFSTNENNPRHPLENNEGRSSNANGYAPSEVSIDWSVVTAGADLSTADDFKISRTVKSSGILSGCKSHKAVRVSGEGGEVKAAAAMAAPARREWCHRLDSVTPVAKIQADNKLHASHHLYIQQ